MALIEEPVHDEGIDDEHDADERLPEAHGRVLMVVATTGAGFVVLVIVLTEERGDLHAGFVKALHR